MSTSLSIAKMMSCSSFKGRAFFVLILLTLTSLLACSASDEVQSWEYGKRGAEFYAEGEFALAVESLEHSIALDPTNALAYVILGSVYYEMEEYDRSLENIDRAVQLGTSHPTAYHRKARIQHTREQFRLSIDNYSRALELIESSDDEDTTFLLGEVLYDRGLAHFAVENFDRAVDDLSRFVELSGASVEALYWRGQAYLELDRYQLAVSDFSKAMELAPDEEFVKGIYLYRASAYQELDLHRLAINDFNELIGMRPDVAELYLFRGHSYYVLGDSDSAAADAVRAYELDHNIVR